MDSSLQGANLTADELDTTLAAQHEEIEGAEEEHHIHLPNPSLWPFILSAAILVTVTGLLFVPETPWLFIVGAPFVLIGIIGWGLEDPMAAKAERYAAVPVDPALLNSPFQIGQDVLGKDGQWIGTVQARFGRYILVEQGGLFGSAYYVPQNLSGSTKNNVVRLTVSEDDLRDMKSVPDDLYGEAPEVEVQKVTGVPLFARGPLSPAQTGHYNYGPNSPGINTDASGSYDREQVTPLPQKYVGERRKMQRRAG